MQESMYNIACFAPPSSSLWLEHPAGVGMVMGLILLRKSDFSLPSLAIGMQNTLFNIYSFYYYLFILWMSSILSSFLLSTWSLLFFPDCSCSCWCLWYGIHGLHFKSIHWYAVLRDHVFFVFELFVPEPNHFDCHITLSGRAACAAFFLNLNVISLPLSLFPFLFLLTSKYQELNAISFIFLKQMCLLVLLEYQQMENHIHQFPKFPR